MISLPYRDSNKPYMQVGNAYSILFKHRDTPIYAYIESLTIHDYNVSYHYICGGEKYYKRFYPTGGYIWNRSSKGYFGFNVSDAIITLLDKSEYPEALTSVLNYRKRRF